jgi:hypothetical protein
MGLARWIGATIQLAYSLTTTSPDLWRQASGHWPWGACTVCLLGSLSESPLRTCSKQWRGVITPRSLSSTCATVPFWPTVCGQSVQLSQPSTWCERGRKVSPLFRSFPSVRLYLFSSWWPHFSPLVIEEGPRSVFPERPSFRFPSLGRGVSSSSHGRSWAGNPLPIFGSLATFLRECSPRRTSPWFFHSTTRWLVAQQIE